MAKYKVLFHGHAYVEADSSDEAVELAKGDDCDCECTTYDGAVEVDDIAWENRFWDV